MSGKHPLAWAAALVLISVSVKPLRADEIQFTVAPFEIRVAPFAVLSVGSQVNISRIDMEGSNVVVIGNIRCDAPKRDLELYAAQALRSTLPLPIYGGLVKVAAIDNISLSPRTDGINVDADFKTNYSMHYHHLSLKISNNILGWTVSQAFLKIVPHSVRIRLSQYTLLNSTESAILKGVIGQGDLNYISETAMQTAIDRYLDRTSVRKYIPQITEITGIKTGWSQSNGRMWLSGRVAAEFSKYSINTELQSFVNSLGPAFEGRSAAEGNQVDQRSNGQIAPNNRSKPAPASGLRKY